MTIFFEVNSRDHHGVAAATEVCGVAEFFSEEITGVDDARDVTDICETKLMGFTYVVLFEIHVFGTLVGDGGGPLDASVVVVVYCNFTVGVGHVEVEGAVADVIEFCDAFICCNYLGFAGAEGGSVLADGFPTNWPP